MKSEPCPTFHFKNAFFLLNNHFLQAFQHTWRLIIWCRAILQWFSLFNELRALNECFACFLVSYKSCNFALHTSDVRRNSVGHEEGNGTGKVTSVGLPIQPTLMCQGLPTFWQWKMKPSPFRLSFQIHLLNGLNLYFTPNLKGRQSIDKFLPEEIDPI